MFHVKHCPRLFYRSGTESAHARYGWNCPAKIRVKRQESQEEFETVWHMGKPALRKEILTRITKLEYIKFPEPLFESI